VPIKKIHIITKLYALFYFQLCRSKIRQKRILETIDLLQIFTLIKTGNNLILLHEKLLGKEGYVANRLTSILA